MSETYNNLKACFDAVLGEPMKVGSYLYQADADIAIRLDEGEPHVKVTLMYELHEPLEYAYRDYHEDIHSYLHNTVSVGEMSHYIFNPNRSAIFLHGVYATPSASIVSDEWVRETVTGITEFKASLTKPILDAIESFSGAERYKQEVARWEALKKKYDIDSIDSF